MEKFYLVAPRTFMDPRGRFFHKTADGKMVRIEDEKTSAEDRYIARHMKGESDK